MITTDDIKRANSLNYALKNKSKTPGEVKSYTERPDGMDDNEWNLLEGMIKKQRAFKKPGIGNELLI